MSDLLPEPPRTICMIGGSFNPIHMGHLQMARSAQAHCLADEVWFVPAGKPWQKPADTLMPADERLLLTELATHGVHSWRVDSIEMDQTGPSYTVDTLERLCELHPDARFILVIGADQLNNLTTWKHWESLFDFARIGVVDRGDYGDFNVPNPLKRHLIHNRIFRIPMPPVAVSATEVRHQLALLGQKDYATRENARARLEAMLPKRVYEYLYNKFGTV